MSVIHQPRKPDLDARVLLFPAILAVLLGIIFFRLWYFQVVQAASLAEKATAINQTNVAELAPRGLIFDRNGVMLAGVKPEWVVTGVPKLLDKSPDTLKQVAAILGANPARLKSKLEQGRWKPYLPTPIYIGANTQAASVLAERSDDFPGIDVRSQPMRYYPDTTSFSHLMGYVWVPSQNDVERIEEMGKKPADYVGQGGIEEFYEKELMGEAGQIRMEVDSKRRPTKVIGRDIPTAGSQLILSLDKNLQQVAVKALAGRKGAVAAVDPKTGEVLCLASSPTFDLGYFRRGISQTDYDMYQKNPAKPFMNRPIQLKYAPGSTFKIVTTIAAMEQGLFDPNRPEYCSGGIQVGNRKIKCLGNHGSITFHRAMAKSCNAYFMSLALKSKRAGVLKASLDVGVYQKTGLDLPNGAERRGDLATEKYMETYYPKYRWPLGDTANLGIGQGILATTPLQMANVVAMVANDGVSYRPHLVKGVRDAADPSQVTRVTPEVIHKVDASPAFWSTMKAALVEVIEAGTAGKARISGLRWGGKTGSAEEKKFRKTHSWFVGFAPYDNPKIAICVLVEEAGHGGDIAAPIAKSVVERYLVPSNDPAASSNRPTASRTPSASSPLPIIR